MNAVLCIGELLIDFFSVEVDIELSKAVHFEKQAGGAPANVCATIAKLGGRSVFAGKVGDDSFGHFLEQTLLDMGVGVDFLVKDATISTTLAFVSRKTGGERDFLFNRGADAQFLREEVDEMALFEHEIIHFGSATALLNDPFYTTYCSYFNHFHKKQAFLSFDPNYREDLWKGRQAEFIEKCVPFIQSANFIKVSEEELALLSGEKTIALGVERLHVLGAQWLTVTCGARGTYFSDGRSLMNIPSITVTSIDSTGAGDAFVGAMLYQLAQAENPFTLKEETLKEMIKFANRVGARVCEKIGAIEALPTLAELESIKKI